MSKIGFANAEASMDESPRKQEVIGSVLPAVDQATDSAWIEPQRRG